MIALALLLAAPQVMPADRIAGSRKDAERAMADFAACEVKSADGYAAALAFSREVEGTPSNYRKRLIKSPCAARGTSLRFQPGLFRLALFPALYARDFDGTPSEGTLTLRRFGDCVVRQDAAGSRALVLSKLYSDAETAAVQALQPALGQCVTGGSQLRFSRSVIRGAVGEALYKLTAATAATKAN